MTSHYAPKPPDWPPAAYATPLTRASPDFDHNADSAPGTSPQSRPAHPVYSNTSLSFLSSYLTGVNLGFTIDRPVQSSRYPSYGKIAIAVLGCAFVYVVGYIVVMLLWWACCQDRIRVQEWTQRNWLGELEFFLVLMAAVVGLTMVLKSSKKRVR